MPQVEATSVVHLVVAADCGQLPAALRRSAEREPDYGPVWSALATLHCQMYSFDAPGFENALETAHA